MSVAESTVIFGPMLQVGCASASIALTSARSARVRPRNGPPEAVRTSECNGVRSPAVEELEGGRVLASRPGSSRPPPRRQAARREVAAGDEALLVGEREVDAVLQGPEGCRQPGEADDGVEDDVRLGAVEQLRQVAADLGERGQAVDRPVAPDAAATSSSSGWSRDDLERLAPDRPRGARGARCASSSPV